MIELIRQWVEKEYKPKVPQSTSIRTGAIYTQELLSGNDHTFQTVARMPKATFHKLHEALVENGALKGSVRVPTEMSVLIFLDIVGQSNTTRYARNVWQVSSDTISRHFHKVLRGILALAPEYICFPDPTEVEVEIAKDPRRRRYFTEAYGAMDGTLW